MPLFDTHCHLNFQAFTDDWKAVTDACRREDMFVNIVGSQLATSQRAVEIAEQYPAGVWATVGLHPTHAEGSGSHPESFLVDTYRTLATSSSKVVAIGETGIDFFHDTDNFKHQQALFLQHIWLAKELDLPLVIHGRNSRDSTKSAYEEILRIVKAEGVSRAVVHCFGDGWPMAHRFIEQGLHIGFTGIITFPKSDALHEIVRTMPLDRLLIETDAPYLAPQPNRGQRNTPLLVRHVAEKIAELRGISYDEVVAATFANAKKLFLTS